MFSVNDVLGYAGAAQHIDLAVQSLGCQLFLPILGPGGEHAVLAHAQSLDHGEDRDLLRKVCKYVLKEPFGAVRRDAAYDVVGAWHHFLPVLEVVEGDAGREGTGYLRIGAGADALVDDLSVEGGADDPDVHTVHGEGEHQGRAHHSKSYYGNCH